MSDIDALVGKTVSQVWFGDDHLTFVTDQDMVSFEVEGDCCSHSVFNDFVGLEKLQNGPITEVKAMELGSEEDPYREYIQYYGYSLTTEHKIWGPMTTVFSFRNESNGYYGGWMSEVSGEIYPDQKLLTQDVFTS